MQRINIFIKKDWYYNLVDNQLGDKLLLNPPMYNLQIHLYKGIDNKIEFCIRNNDRKSVDCEGKTFTLTIINPKLNKKLVKVLEVVDNYKGVFKTLITEAEMRDFEPATYEASVVYADDETGDETMLYSSINYDPVFHITVEDGFREVYKPSVVLNPEDFLHNFYVSREDGQRYDYWESSNIKADENDYHTAAITVVDKFIGKVVMEGSMEVDPSQDENNWFEIDSYEWDESTASEGETIQFNRQVNCLWVRFKYLVKAINQPTGKVQEILYRN